jgi:hypothetical protein
VARRCRELIKRVLENRHRLLEYVQLRLRQVSPNWQKLASVLYGVEQLHPKRRPNTTATITTTEVTFTTTYSRLPKILILLKRLESSQIVYGLIPGLDIEVRISTDTRAYLLDPNHINEFYWLRPYRDITVVDLASARILGKLYHRDEASLLPSLQPPAIPPSPNIGTTTPYYANRIYWGTELPSSRSFQPLTGGLAQFHSILYKTNPPTVTLIDAIVGLSLVFRRCNQPGDPNCKRSPAADGLRIYYVCCNFYSPRRRHHLPHPRQQRGTNHQDKRIRTQCLQLGLEPVGATPTNNPHASSDSDSGLDGCCWIMRHIVNSSIIDTVLTNVKELFNVL